MSESFTPPTWCKEPKLTNCALLVKKEDKLINKINLVNRQKCVTFGRNAQMSNIKLDHPSISRRHALLGHGSSGNIYVMDLGSSHGTFLNDKRIDKMKRECLSDMDIIKFGASTRKYIVRLDVDAPEPKNDDKKHQLDTKDGEPSTKRRKLNSGEKLDINAKVRCRHLLVKHKDSRRPSSWKEDKITRTKEEAIEIITKYKSEIEEKAGKNDVIPVFEEYSKEHSDCNSHKRGGDLGSFGRGKMQKPFEDAAFSLPLNTISDPVETASGVHLILRYQ